jgi:hypothetical protein
LLAEIENLRASSAALQVVNTQLLGDNELFHMAVLRNWKASSAPDSEYRVRAEQCW